MINKLTSIISAAAIMAASILIPAAVHAADSDFIVENGVIIEYAGTDESLTIPSTINGETITAIGSSAFSNNYTLQSVSVPEGVTVIKARAFSSCGFLSEISLPESLTEIETGAFRNTSLTSITIPKNVNVIGEDAFYYCRSLSKITVINRTVDLMNTLSRVANNFVMYGYGDSLARKFANREEVPFYDIETGELLEAPAIDNYDYDVYNGVLLEYKGNDTELTIPAQVNGETITKIGEDALAEKQLTKVTFPETVVEIGDYALSYNSFTEFTIPDSVKIMGKGVFINCEQLETIHIGSGLEAIESDTFSGIYNLKSIDVTEGNNYFNSEDGILFSKDKSVLYKFPCASDRTEYTVTSDEIAPFAFEYSKNLNSIILSDSVTAIGERAFIGCSGITELNIGKNVTYIGGGIAYGVNALTEITVDSENPSYSSIDGVLYTKDGKTLLQYPANKAEKYYFINNIDTIAPYAMAGALNLKKIDVTAKTIDNNAFEFSSAKEIVVGNGTESIGKRAFYSHYTLERLYVADSVDYIGESFAHISTKIYCTIDSEAVYAAEECECEIELITELPKPSPLKDKLEMSINDGGLIIENSTGDSVNAVLYVVEYAPETQSIVNISKEEMTISVGQYENNHAIPASTKIFLWDKNMKPLANAVSVQ